jgi:hypothetical protein
LIVHKNGPHNKNNLNKTKYILINQHMQNNEKII